MIRVSPISDMALVAEVMRHPKVYPFIRDDAAPLEPELWTPAPAGHSIHYVGAWQDDTFLGLWMFHQRNHATWEVHTCLLPVAYGRPALDAVRAAEAWFWAAHPEAARVVTAVSRDNMRALRFAQYAGMQVWGTNAKGLRRAGVLLDEIWLGKSRPEILQ